MNFERILEGMTPQEAADKLMDEIKRDEPMDSISSAAARLRIAEACEHFRARGVTEARRDEDREAMELIREAAKTIRNPQNDVRQFMQAFGQAIPERPQWPDQETMDLRVRLVAEEFCEWLRDSGYSFTAIVTYSSPKFSTPVFETSNWSNNKKRSLPKSADALIDLLYVTIGTLSAMGINMWPLWAEVQRANMAKTGGPVVNGKQMKPEGWTPPDIAGELRKQGWEGVDGR